MQGEQVKLDAVCFSKAGRMPAIRHGRQDASGTISGTRTASQVAGRKISSISALREYRQAGSTSYFTWENP